MESKIKLTTFRGTKATRKRETISAIFLIGMLMFMSGTITYCAMTGAYGLIVYNLILIGYLLYFYHKEVWPGLRISNALDMAEIIEKIQESGPTLERMEVRDEMVLTFTPVHEGESKLEKIK